jgi:hypothetical protein
VSAASLAKFIGQTGSLTVELSLTLTVRVLDARKCWDRLDFYVEPLHGTGQRWVQADRVTLDVATGGAK